MKKSMHLGLHEYFDQVRSFDRLSNIERSLHIRHAEETYWKQQDEEAILQEFDGHQGYLYYIDLLLAKERCIPLEIDRADLHILYVLSDNGPVNIYDQQTTTVCSLPTQRALYLYLPPEDYAIQLPRGATKIFGFYFRASIFRAGNERKYDFLHPLLHAYRNQSNLPKASVDFKVGPRTRRYIEALCRNLQVRQLHNESFIMDKLIQLIELSREKVIEEDSRTHHDIRIAEQAQNLLIQYVELEGQHAHIKKLAEDLPLALAHINRLHKQYFGKTLRKLREELLIEKACFLLRSGTSPTECAYALNYNSPEAFYHFFKAKMGVAPSQFIKTAP